MRQANDNIERSQSVLERVVVSFRLRQIVAWLAVCAAPSLGGAIEIEGVDALGPKFEPVRQVHVLPQGIEPLWREALDREEATLHADVAQAVSRASRLGVAGLDQFVPLLVRAFERDDEPAVARLAIARALIALDARQTAAMLAKAADVNRDMGELVEPALARWDYRPMRQRWLARLAAPDTSRRPLVLAIQSLAAVNESSASPPLRKLASGPETAEDIRLEAARALAVLCPMGLEEDARALAADKSMPGTARRLAAAAMLSRHSGSVTQDVLVELAADTEPAVVAAALGQLTQLNPHAATVLNAKLAANSDARVRRLTIELLVAQQTVAAVETLATMLADPHPHVRRDAADALVRLASIEALAAAVRDAATGALDAPSPEAREQAALVIGAIAHQPAAEGILKLLDGQPPAVTLAAAWALCRLAAPETGEAIFAKLTRDADRISAYVRELAPIYARGESVAIDVPRYRSTYRAIEHLILALGRMRYRAADGFLRSFVPKPVPQVGEPPELELSKQANLRAAAIWSLGMLHEGQAPADLVEGLRARLGDTTPIPAESALVRRMAALSLVAMNAKDAVPTLREQYDPQAEANALGRTCGWGVEQLTGETLPHRTVREVQHAGWFLEPLAR